MTGSYRPLQVPTLVLEAEVLCADGRSFRGRVFMPELAARHNGPMRPEEWMNEPASFFPFRPEDGSGSVLMNRHEVLVFTISAEGHAGLEEDGGPVGVRRRVIVECRDRRFEGEVIMDMPSHLSRVQDYLNRADPFLIVHDGARVHLIRKARITRVIEVKEK